MSVCRFALGLVLLCLFGCARPDPALQEAATRNERAPDVYRVRFETSKGAFVLEVQRGWGPLGADRFYTLVKHGFFDGARFFRVLPKFGVQFGIAGDPALNRQWRDSNLPDDPVTQTNRRGTISFAISSAGTPNARATQIFINLADNQRLDKKGLAPFGEVTAGMDVVDQFFSGYAEGPPMGIGPDQTRIEKEGNGYLEREYPNLDYIKKATLQ